MSDYSKANFAKLLHRRNSFVTTNVDRGKIVVDEAGRIDPEHPINAAFLKKFFTKNDKNGNPKEKGVNTKRAAPKKAIKPSPPRTVEAAEFLETFYETDLETLRSADKPAPDAKPKPKAPRKPEQPASTPDVPDTTGLLLIGESERKYKHHLAEKTEKDVELVKLKIEKARGEVIPTAPIEHLVYQMKQYILAQQKIADEAMLNEITQAYEVSVTDMAHYRGQFIKNRNRAMEIATNTFTANLNATLAEYSTKRGVGERV